MMLDLEYIKLTFTTPLHFSQGKASFETTKDVLHSDMLKSALFASAIALYGTEKITKKSFLEHLQISSAFPFLGEELFFPKPLIKPPISTFDGQAISALALDKKMRKVKYLGQSLFEKFISGASNISLQQKHFLQGGSLLSESFLDHPDPFKVNLFNTMQSQRIYHPHWGIPTYDAQGKLVRDESGEIVEEEVTPFYMEKLFFQEHAGLYFFIQIKDEAVRDYLKGALRLLSDSGLGTDRNTGYGQFTWSAPQKMQLRIPPIEQSNAWMNLGLYCPKSEDLQEDLLSQSSYQLLKRGGWISSPSNDAFYAYRKKSIYMFGEGGVFPKRAAFDHDDATLEKGKICDLKPDVVAVDAKTAHPIWRDGRSIFLPIKLN